MSGKRRIIWETVCITIMELVELALKDVLSTLLLKKGITSGNVITMYMWLLKKKIGAAQCSLCQTNVPCEYRNPTLTFAKH